MFQLRSETGSPGVCSEHKVGGFIQAYHQKKSRLQKKEKQWCPEHSHPWGDALRSHSGDKDVLCWLLHLCALIGCGSSRWLNSTAGFWWSVLSSNVCWDCLPAVRSGPACSHPAHAVAPSPVWRLCPLLSVQVVRLVKTSSSNLCFHPLLFFKFIILI